MERELSLRGAHPERNEVESKDQRRSNPSMIYLRAPCEIASRQKVIHGGQAQKTLAMTIFHGGANRT